MQNKSHEMVNVSYDGKGKRFGSWTADCTCRHWVGMGSTKENLEKKFKKHIAGK